MCDEAVHKEPYLLEFVSNSYETQDMGIKEVKEDPWDLAYVSDHIKAHMISDDEVCEDLDCLQFILNWLVRLKLVQMWDGGENYCYDNKLAEWCNGSKRHKALKKVRQKVVTCRMAFIKMEDLCMTENDKIEIGKV